MLTKLIKHEMRATGRTIGLMLLAALAVALVVNLSWGHLVRAEGALLKVVVGVLTASYVLGIIALAVVCMVMVVQRFYSSFLKDEGYLMLTLPTSIHSLVWSKLIVSVIWYLATGFVICVAIFALITSFDSTAVLGAIREVLDAVNRFIAESGAPKWTLALMSFEVIASILLTAVINCLLFYAAMAIGQTSSSKKIGSSVVAYIGIMVATQATMSILGTLVFPNVQKFVPNGVEGFLNGFHLLMLMILAVDLILGVLYYLVTVTILKKRLNLE